MVWSSSTSFLVFLKSSVHVGVAISTIGWHVMPIITYSYPVKNLVSWPRPALLWQTRTERGQVTDGLQDSTEFLSENFRNDWVIEAEMRRRNLLAWVFHFRSHSNIFSCRKWSSHCCSHNSMISGVACLESTWKQWIRASNLSASFLRSDARTRRIEALSNRNPDSVRSQTDPTFLW
jgi:hypothetical protein